MHRNLFLVPALLACCALGNVTAQSLFVTAGDTGSSIGGYTSDPLSFAANFAGAPNSFFVASSPNGARYYSVGRSATDTVVVLEGSFPSLTATRRVSLGAPAVAAALSADARRLLVLTTALHIIDTATDAAIGSGIDVGATPSAVVSSIDGTRAFVLSISSQRVTAVDTQTGQVAGTYSVPTAPASLTLGPNALLYIGAANAIYVVDPRTMALRTTITTRGTAGPISFTPDGRLGVAVNTTVSTGPAAFVLDVASNAVTEVQSVGVQMDEVVVPDNTRAFLHSLSGGKVYLVNLPATTIGQTISTSEFNFGTFGVSNVRDIAITNEQPSARYMFLNIGGSLQRFDLGSNSLASTQLSVAGTGPIVLAGATAGGSVTNVVAFNNNQVIAAGQPSLPLVLRVLDPAGRPISGVPVSFATNVAGATVQGAQGTTGIGGYVAAVVTPPASALAGTSIPVSVVVGPGLQTSFNLTVGAPGSNPGGPNPGTPVGLQMVGGQGQILSQNSFTTEPMTVRITDAAGNPLSGQTVNWQVIAGQGTVNPTVSVTDTQGIATANFIATALVQPGTPFDQAQILATSSSGSATFYMTTLFSRPGQLPDQPQVLLDTPASRSLTGRATETQQGAIKVRIISLTGQPIPNVGVRIINSGESNMPTANCVNTFALTDATGLATCDVVFGSVVGSTGITVRSGGFDFPVALTVTAGGPTAIQIVQGNNQSGTAGSRLAQSLVVEVQSNGQPVANQAITWEVPTPGTVTLSNVDNTTNAQGRASAVATLGSTPGTAIVRARAGNATATFSLTVTAVGLTLTRVSGDAQTASASQAFGAPLVVQVTDNQNRGVAGTPVAFSVVTGSGNLSTLNATTDANGRASVNVTAGTTTGALVVSAAAAGQSVAFNLTVRPAGPAFTASDIVNGASFQPGIAPGGLATIRGTGIARGVQGVVTPTEPLGPLPMKLAGVEVLFNNIPAPIYSVVNSGGREEVTVQVPFEVTAGSATVEVRVDNGGSTTVQGVAIQPAAPAIFEFPDTSGLRYAVAIRPDGSFVTTSNPARRGERITAFVSGLGQTTPALATNRGGVLGSRILLPIIVGINNEGIPGDILAESLPGLVGVYAVTFTVPQNTPAGQRQAFAIAIDAANGQRYTGPGSFLAIQ